MKRNVIAKCPLPSFVEVEYVELVDQSMSQDFNINEFGHISNDISNLLKAQTNEEFSAILARMPENKTTSPFEGMSDDEIIQHIMPPKYQDPVELARYFDYMANLEYKKLSENSDDVKKDVKQDVKQVVVDPVNDKDIIENV